MSLKSLKENIKSKSKIKEAYIEDLRDVSKNLSSKVEKDIVRVINAAVSNLDTNDDGIIKNNTFNKQLIKATSSRINKEIKKYRDKTEKALVATGVVALDVYNDLKKQDVKYLGKDRYGVFTTVNDSVIEDSAKLHKGALRKNNADMNEMTEYINDTLESGYMFNLTKGALVTKLLSATEHVNISNAGATMYSKSLGDINAFGGKILNFYTEVAFTQEDGLKEVFNSNPMDSRTKPLCASATMAGVISVKDMSSTYGFPPRYICRCDVVYLKKEWKNAKKDVNNFISEQEEQWRNILVKSPRRKDGQFYSSVEEQLKVLSGEFTPKKFKQTALHTSKMRDFTQREFSSLLRDYKSSYAMRYSQ